MRYHRLRFDIWLCLLLSFLVSLGTESLAKMVVKDSYKSYVEEHTVADGEIGGKVDDTVFRAQSVEDLLSHETFTVVSPGIEYRNEGGGYHGGYYMDALTLPSGEIIAARINQENVISTGDTIFDGDSIMPLGKIVFEDLTEDEYFINQIEYATPLSRRDFYIDMMGNGGKLQEEDYQEAPILIVQLMTIVICFPLFHMLGSKFGIFPAFFSLKKKEAEWK